MMRFTAIGIGRVRFPEAASGSLGSSPQTERSDRKMATTQNGKEEYRDANR